LAEVLGCLGDDVGEELDLDAAEGLAWRGLERGVWRRRGEMEGVFGDEMCHVTGALSGQGDIPPSVISRKTLAVLAEYRGAVGYREGYRGFPDSGSFVGILSCKCAPKVSSFRGRERSAEAEVYVVDCFTLEIRN
jgi:hypothetical protein